MKGSRWPLRARVLSVAVGLGATALASWAVADGLSPGVPATVVVGDPRGAAPRDRVDAHRRGRAHTLLPEAPKELWRRELAGGVVLPPVVDDRGGIVVALSSPDLVRLDEDGQQTWRVRLGAAAPSVPPVIASDGSILVVAEDGILWSVSAGGSIRFSVDLATSTKAAGAAPLARDDGSVVVAGSQELVVVAADGSVRARTAIDGRPVGGLLPHEGGVLVTTREGDVWRWTPPGSPRRMGTFGGQMTAGASKVSSRTVVGVVERERVVGLDLVTGATTLLLSAAAFVAPLEDTVTLTPAGVLLATSVVGEVAGIDARGVLVQRGALEKVPTMFTTDAGVPPMFRWARMSSSPPLVVDPGGRVAFARNLGKIGALSSEGVVHTASPRQCARPVALLPAGKARFVIACRSGSVAVFGDP